MLRAGRIKPVASAQGGGGFGGRNWLAILPM
jgi:hypothetical protein